MFAQNLMFDLAYSCMGKPSGVRGFGLGHVITWYSNMGGGGSWVKSW